MSASTEVRSRPILFSGPMVRAILDGRKTQTRRVVKNHPGCDFELGTYHKICVDRHGEQYPACDESFGIFALDGSWSIECPYGTVGDRLWVRESFALVNPLAGCELNCRPEYDGVRYRATWTKSHSSRWKPSIHMPRRASRIDLEITGIRVERVQEISEEDAIAEGVESKFCYPDAMVGSVMHKNYLTGEFDQIEQGSFRTLWTSINGQESWVANPWVWVIDFKRIKP